MENKIISIDITSDTQGEIKENAGVMWEHNATTLKLNVAPECVGDYKYYIEYSSITGIKVRTEYLTLDTETNTILYDIPVSMTSQGSVECYFNIITVDENGNTVQVVKPKRFCLSFDYSPDTDNSIADAHDFSINTLLDAIEKGTFKGDKGDQGEPFKYENFTEEQLAALKGKITIDTEMSRDSENAVQNKVIVAYVDKVSNNAYEIFTSEFYRFGKDVERFIAENVVLKTAGKDLSTNDFTDEDKLKLDNSASKEYVDDEITKIRELLSRLEVC